MFIPRKTSAQLQAGVIASACGLLMLLAPETSQAQVASPNGWKAALAGDGLWLTEPLRTDPVQRGTWVRFNNVDAMAWASVGDVAPIPIEFEAAFDPAWGGSNHRIYAEIIMKVDGQVVFGERIPETGYWTGGAQQISANRTAMLGIGQAPTDGELTIEVLGILYDDGAESMVGSNGQPIYEGLVYSGHPYYGGNRFDNTQVLRETRRVQHLRVDNPFVVDSIGMKTTGTCPGPAEISLVARSAYGGQNALHPKTVEVMVSGIEDRDGWDWSPEATKFSMGPNDHHPLSFSGVYRSADPCAVYDYSSNLVLTASGKYNMMPASSWSNDSQSAVKRYWETRSWTSRFTIGSGSAAQSMPLAIAVNCIGPGECPDRPAPSLADTMTEKRFKMVSNTPRVHDGPLQNPDDLTIYLPAGALEGETIRGTVVATGDAIESISPAAIHQITINNVQVSPFEDKVYNDDRSAAAQQFTWTATNGGGLANVALSTSRGPVPLTTMTIMAEESTPSVNPTLMLANVPDVLSWNPNGQALWAPGMSGNTSPMGMLPADAYRPVMSATDPVAPIITGLSGGQRMMVGLTDADVNGAVVSSPYMGIGFLDALSEYYRDWAKDPYKDASEIVSGTAPMYINPGGMFTYVGPTPSAGGPYGASGNSMTHDPNRGYASGWDPNKSTLENIVLKDPETGAIVERLPILSQSSLTSSGYVPATVEPGVYDVSLETNDGQVIDTKNKTIAVKLITDNDAVVQRGSTGNIRMEIDGHGDGKEKEQDEEKEGKTLRPELRFFWNSLSQLPGDWTNLGYAPRRGSFLNEFVGTQKPVDASMESTQQQKKEDPTEKLWKKEKKQPEMFVTIFNLTPEIIRFNTGSDVMTMPVYSDTTSLDIPFTGIQTGAYAVRIQVEEPEFNALEPDNLRNLNPEENPLLKMATNGWDESMLDGYNFQ